MKILIKMKYKPTDRELEIIKHSLGLNREKIEYRNYFNTGIGSDDFDDCENLYKNKLMNRLEKSKLFPGYFYIVTDLGKESLNEK